MEGSLFTAYCARCEESVVTLSKKKISKELLEETTETAKRNRYALAKGIWERMVIALEYLEREHLFFFALLLSVSVIACILIGTVSWWISMVLCGIVISLFLS